MGEKLKQQRNFNALNVIVRPTTRNTKPKKLSFKEVSGADADCSDRDDDVFPEGNQRSDVEMLRWHRDQIKNIIYKMISDAGLKKSLDEVAAARTVMDDLADELTAIELEISNKIKRVSGSQGKSCRFPPSNTFLSYIFTGDEKLKRPSSVSSVKDSRKETKTRRLTSTSSLSTMKKSSSTSKSSTSTTRSERFVTLRYKPDEVYVEPRRTPTLEEMGPEQAAAARMIRKALDESLSPEVVAMLPPVPNNLDKLKKELDVMMTDTLNKNLRGGSLRPTDNALLVRSIAYQKFARAMKGEFKWMDIDSEKFFYMKEDPNNPTVGSKHVDLDVEVEKAKKRDAAYGLCWRTIEGLENLRKRNPTLDRVEKFSGVMEKVCDIAEALKVLHDGILDNLRMKGGYGGDSGVNVTSCVSISRDNNKIYYLGQLPPVIHPATGATLRQSNNFIQSEYNDPISSLVLKRILQVPEPCNEVKSEHVSAMKYEDIFNENSPAKEYFYNFSKLVTIVRYCVIFILICRRLQYMYLSLFSSHFYLIVHS